MKFSHYAVAAALAMASTVLADDKKSDSSGSMTTTMSTMTLDLGGMNSLLGELDKASEDLKQAMIVHSSRAETTRQDQIRARAQEFEAEVDDLQKEMSSRTTFTADAKDVQDAVKAYFQVVQASSWVPKSETLAKDLLPVQVLMDRLVAPYGGFSSFELPEGVEMSHLRVTDVDLNKKTGEIEVTREPAAVGSGENVDFTVKSDKTTTTVVDQGEKNP